MIRKNFISDWPTGKKLVAVWLVSILFIAIVYHIAFTVFSNHYKTQSARQQMQTLSRIVENSLQLPSVSPENILQVLRKDPHLQYLYLLDADNQEIIRYNPYQTPLPMALVQNTKDFIMKDRVISGRQTIAFPENRGTLIIGIREAGLSDYQFGKWFSMGLILLLGILMIPLAKLIRNFSDEPVRRISNSLAHWQQNNKWISAGFPLNGKKQIAPYEFCDFIIEKVTACYSRITEYHTAFHNSNREISEKIDSLESKAIEQNEIFGNTRHSIKEVNGSLLEVENSTAQLSKSIAQVSGTTIEVLENLNEMAEKAGVMMQSVNQTSMGIEELVTSIEQISQNVKSANEITMKANTVAREGQETIQSSLSGIEQVAEKMDEAYLKIERLNNNSQKIGEIVNMISEVADQTNLLALNAAIEAARAGESGRGFAVVADEIRKLAEKTSTATREIVNMIQVIHNDTHTVFETMTSGKAEIDRGVAQSDKAKQALTEIQNQVKEVFEIMNDISSATHQQAAGAGQIINAVEDMRQLTENVTQAIQNQAQKNAQIRSAIDNLGKGSEKTTIAVTHQTLRVKEITQTMEQLNQLAEAIVNFSSQLRESSDTLNSQILSLEKHIQPQVNGKETEKQEGVSRFIVLDDGNIKLQN